MGGEEETRVTTKSVVVNPRKLGPLGFVREVVRARRVGPGPETVFRLFRPFHGPEFDAIYDRVMADEAGRRVLRDRPPGGPDRGLLAAASGATLR